MKKTGLLTGNIILVLLVGGILTAVNVLAQNWFFRLDLTEDKVYSIAPATRRILEGMDDVVNIEAYFSRDLPSYLARLSRQVQDMLDEYRAYAGGSLNVVFKDPGDDPVMRQKLRSLGIPEVQLEILEKDQFQLTTAYMGLALLYGGKKEVIPVVRSTSRLEYELTSAILRLTAPERKSIGWLGGDREEAALRGGGSPLEMELRRSYEVENLVPEGLVEIAPEIDTVVAAGPRDLPEEARFALDQFLMRGGSMVVLVDHFSMPPGGLFPAPLESGVHDLLEHYGVRVNEDVVVEPFYNAQASFSSGFMQFRLPYPFWPRVTGDFLNSEHPVTAGLESIVLPWTSSLEVLVGEGAEVEAEILASSSPSSWRETGQHDFSPQRKIRPPVNEEDKGGRPLAVLLHGRFRSFWEDKEPPAPAEGGSVPEVVKESPKTSIIVLGSSQMARNEFLQQFPADAVFMMNAVDWLTLGSDLIGIRSRAGGERTLGELSTRKKTMLKVVNIVLVPFSLAVFGSLYLLSRRRKNDAY